MYNEVNDVIRAILAAAEKKHGLDSSMLTPCAKRFALIITTLELLLRAWEEKAEDSFTAYGKGWLEGNLDKEDIKGAAGSEGWESIKWGKSRLGTGVKRYADGGKPLATKSENVLGVLVDNAVKKMKQLKTGFDVYGNIMEFIRLHRSLFYVSDNKWDGSGTYIGRLIEDEESIAIQIRVNRGMEWLLAHGAKLSDEELKGYIEKAKDIKKSELESRLGRLLGNNVPLKDFPGLAKKGHGGRAEWKGGEQGMGANNTTLAEIILDKGKTDTEGMKDSDKKGRKGEAKG